MNNLDDDKLIARFFSDNAVSIEDNGFSRRVMRSLPSRATRLNRVWTAVCAVALIIVAVKMNVVALLQSMAYSLVPDFLAGVAWVNQPLFLLMAVCLTASLAASVVLIRQLQQ